MSTNSASQVQSQNAPALPPPRSWKQLLRSFLTSKAFVWSLIAVALILVFLFLFPASPDTHPIESLVRISDLKSAQIRVIARLQRNRLEDDSADLLEIEVENNSATSLDAPHIHLTAPGFSLDANDPDFAQQQQSLPCFDEFGKTVSSVPSRQSCRFKVLLKPACQSGAYGVTTFVNWGVKDSAGESILLLAPVTIDRTWSAARFVQAAKRFGSLLKDLALPIMLAILGAFFAKRQSDLEANRKSEEARIESERTEKEKQAENKRIEADKEQAERQEVGRLLLNRILDLAQNHYLPFVSQAKSVLIEAKKNRDSTSDADFEKLFFHLLLLLKHMEIFRLQAGGVFFKRRDGETAMSAAWFLLKTYAYKGLGGDEVIAHALRIVESNWDYVTYKHVLNGSFLRDAWTSFKNWRGVAEDSKEESGSFWQIVGVIDAFQAIASFEADYAFKYWYEKERDPKSKLFFQDGKTVLYYRKKEDPQNLTDTLKTLLNTLYGREVEVKEVNGN